MKAPLEATSEKYSDIHHFYLKKPWVIEEGYFHENYYKLFSKIFKILFNIFSSLG